ncbi:biotin/lipoyl-containing protein, partial [Sphingomonas sp.]|uniref:biotin/lipoyl-containing protein n=1 Tax=Sphingomonas sp. TaxID=28214 RepID=UPI003B39FF66
MARVPFKLPDIGEGIAEAEIVAWHVKVGDRIGEDDPLCDMMTDKATVEMTAPVTGTVVEIAGEVGDPNSIGTVQGGVDSEGGAVEEPTIQVAPPEAAAVAESILPGAGGGGAAPRGGGGGGAPRAWPAAGPHHP